MAKKTNEELIELIRSGKDRQENLLQLYNQNQGVIYKLCKPFSRKIDMADLLQEAFIVLAEAVDKYNPKSECAFLTVFHYAFLSHFNRIVYRNYTPVKLPYNLSDMARKYRKVKTLYLQELNREPTDANYCYELNIDLKTLARIRTYINTDVISFDSEHTNQDGGLYSLVDMLKDPVDQMDEVLDQEQQKELKEAMDKVLSRLPEESAKVLKMRFYEQKTLKECGEALGKTKDAAKICEVRALNTIRRTPESINLLRTFVSPEEVYDLAMNRKGLKSFLTDRTSPTEYAAMKLFTLEEQKRSQAKKQAAYYDYIGAKYMTDRHLAAEA